MVSYMPRVVLDLPLHHSQLLRFRLGIRTAAAELTAGVEQDGAPVEERGQRSYTPAEERVRGPPVGCAVLVAVPVGEGVEEGDGRWQGGGHDGMVDCVYKTDA